MIIHSHVKPDEVAPLPPKQGGSPRAMSSASLFKSWLFPGVAIIAGVLVGRENSSVGGWAFLASMGFMGLPHGGCDPWLPYWLGKSRGEFGVMMGLYLALVAVMAVLWWLSSNAAIIVFLAITAWHWGSTDARWLGIRYGRLWGLGRGLFIVGASVGWQPASSTAFFNMLGATAPFLESLTASSFWIGFLGIGLEYLALSLGRQRSWRAAVVESVGLVSLFSLVHPLLAITAYYAGTHAFRSIEIIGPWLPLWCRKRPLLGFHLAAAPGALAVLVLLPLCAALLPSSTQGYERWVATYFVLLSVLTLPHAILFAMLPLTQPQST